MAGFIRRYGYVPSPDQIQQIEGVVILDLPPPAQAQAQSVGVACCIGEFADVSSAVVVSASGVVSSNPQPQEVFSAQDLLNKFGGWDETLGDFGVSGGNGFVAVRGRSFSRLVCLAINNASAQAVRLVRALPTNVSPTAPVPAVAMQAASVPAGYQFANAGNRVRVADVVTFTDSPAYASGTDGALAAGAAAPTATFTAASLAALPAGTIRVGDIIVIGVIGDATYGVAGILGSRTGTYRVTATPTATTLTIEQLEGGNFTPVTQGTIPWRLHPAATADSAARGNAGNAGVAGATTAGGLTVPVRPLDATILTGVLLTVSPPPFANYATPPAATATSWDPLSGLVMVVGATGITYTAAVQAPNVAASATLDALYTAALDSLLTENAPGRDVNIVWCARTSPTIRSYGKGHAIVASSRGTGRLFITAPDLSVQTTLAAIGSNDPGVGANRDERTLYQWPAAQTFVREAVNFPVKTAIAGMTTADGILDLRTDSFMASLLSVLPPERNPGQAAPPVDQALSGVLGFARGTPNLSINDYIALRAAGVCALRQDRDVGFIFQSGRTTSLQPGQQRITRRRMADFLEDSLARIYKPFVKLPMTTQITDSIAAEANAFLMDLQSPNNPVAQKIGDYSIDTHSGNTPESLAAGVFAVSVRVRILPTLDVIVIQAEIGESVRITTT